MKLIENDKYKKTYLPLILWSVVFFASDYGIMYLAFEKLKLSNEIGIKLALSVIVLEIFALIWIMYTGEYVYWLSGGPSFEQAKKAGGEKRKQCVKEYLKTFAIFTVITMVYMIVNFIFKFSMGADITFVLVGIIATAVSTIRIKFEV